VVSYAKNARNGREVPREIDQQILMSCI